MRYSDPDMPAPSSGSPGYTIEAREGRVVEARVFGLRTAEDAAAYSLALGTQLLRMPSDARAVLCADHRPVVIYPQAVADGLVALFTQMNTRLERVAILAARSNATLVLQLERLVREAAYPGRKVFFAPEDAQGHLAPVLNPPELRRVREFLDEYRPTA